MMANVTSSKPLFDHWFRRDAICSMCNQLITVKSDPQLLPCCHTACLNCVQSSKVHECGHCSRPFSPSQVSRNIFLLHDQLGGKSDEDITQMIDEATSCSDHKLPLDMYCNVCKKMTCRECLIGPHFDHFQRVERVQAIYEQFRAGLVGWTKSYADNQLSAMKSAHQILNSKSETLKLKQAEIVYRIRECERHVSIAINRQFNRIIKEVVAVVNDEHTRVNQLKTNFDSRWREMSDMNNIIGAMIEQSCVPALLHHSKLISDYVSTLSDKWPQMYGQAGSELHVQLTCAGIETINQDMKDQINKLIKIEVIRRPDVSSSSSMDIKPKPILKRRLEQ